MRMLLGVSEAEIEEAKRRDKAREEHIENIRKSGKLDNFLKDLSELSKKYNLYIGGCGCCGSPFIYTGEENLGTMDVCDCLEYNEEKYDVNI